MVQQNGVVELCAYYFVGVAGTGMSALAQYIVGTGHLVAGSDRQYNPRIQKQLSDAGISLFAQDGLGPKQFQQECAKAGVSTCKLVVSTAIESDNVDLAAAHELGWETLHRSEMLAQVTATRRTIAVSGTSGKSTVTAMVWHIMQTAGLSPSLLSGAGLVSLEAQGLIGNAVAGEGEWLVCEADESDGTLVRYHPEVGIILNLDKDHKEMHELHTLFQTFAAQTSRVLIVNQSHPLAKTYSRDSSTDFGTTPEAGIWASQWESRGTGQTFLVHHQNVLEGVLFELSVPGRHNMENALAATAACQAAGVTLPVCAHALRTYQGIHRRHQILGKVQGITLVDDFAHNPAKIAASIMACQDFTKGRVLAWWQPHGFGPMRFLRAELVDEISAVLRSDKGINERDTFWLSAIYYAGGSAVKDISSEDLAADLRAKGVDATCVDDRKECLRQLVATAFDGDTILLMGARDPSLGEFAHDVLKTLERSVRCSG